MQLSKHFEHDGVRFNLRLETLDGHTHSLATQAGPDLHSAMEQAAIVVESGLLPSRPTSSKHEFDQ